MYIAHYNNDLKDFDAWEGAINTQETIVNAGLRKEFMEQIKDFMKAQGKEYITKCELNDLLWFEPEFCFELVGLKVENEEDVEDNIG